MEDKIRTLLIDDEKSSIITLTKLLEKYAPQVFIIDTADSVESAIDCIEKHKPELIFLDINMPDGDGFEVIENTDFKNYEVIFTTAFDKYAIKAFEFAALHYLLKPIRPKELKEAIERFCDLKKEDSFKQQLEVLNDNFKNKTDRLILPSSNGLTIIELDDIIRCESCNNYTTFFLVSNEQIVVSKSINTYEQILDDTHFSRIHNQHLVNLKYVKKYVKGRGGYVIMKNDHQVDVSEGKRKDFLNKLGEYAKG